MNILIAGASGFVGTELVKSLQNEHSITVLGRDIQILQKRFPHRLAMVTWENLPQIDATNYQAIINLCGYNISASRWNKSVKNKLIDSRVSTNKKLITWLINQNAKPHFICANAVGIYGLQQNGAPEELDENTPIDVQHPRDFLSEIGVYWQQSLLPAVEFGMNVTSTRFGVVLKKGQGMLKKIAPSFYLGLGAVLGDGKQVISWIHIDDLIASIIFLLSKPELTGAFNLTAPNPISQEQFAHILAKTMHRPLLLKMPAWFIKTLFGEMGDCLLLKGQRVIPKRLMESGYQFIYSNLPDALSHEFSCK